MKGPEDVEISWGNTAIFSCHAVGDPQPKIIWMHEEKEVDMKDSRITVMEDGSLVIKNTLESDSGIYECMAKNSDGETKSRPARMIVGDYNTGHEGKIH